MIAVERSGYYPEQMKILDISAKGIDDPAANVLSAETMALNAAISTADALPRCNEGSPPEKEGFLQFHRSRGRYRFSSESSFRKLEIEAASNA